MGSIYRFTSFEGLVDMTQRKALRFVNYQEWEDPYEGFLFRAAKTEAGRKRIIDEVEKTAEDFSLPVYATLSILSECAYMQAWTKYEETDALWRIYGYSNKGLRIEIDTGDVEKLDHVTAHEIDYRNFLSIEEELQAIIDREKREVKLLSALLSKRTAFHHEGEVRLVSGIDLRAMAAYPSEKHRKVMIEALKVGLEKEMISQVEYDRAIKGTEKSQADRYKYMDFSHISNFIKSVMVHPLASDWYTETVGEYCRINGINFLGKSKLYKLEI